MYVYIYIMCIYMYINILIYIYMYVCMCVYMLSSGFRGSQGYAKALQQLNSETSEPFEPRTVEAPPETQNPKP